MKSIQVDRCCNCGFNEHGQLWEFYTPNITYLGTYIVPPTMLPGMPMLYCMFDPKESFRDNLRLVPFKRGNYKRDNGCRVIWIAGDPRYDGEFDKQLQGFPDICPLEDVAK